MATYKSLESLKAAILKEVRSAVDAAAQESKNVLQKNVDEFYSIPEGRYHRIGMLQAAPQLDSVFETKNGAMAQISINTGTQYDPAGRDTETIYGYLLNLRLTQNKWQLIFRRLLIRLQTLKST